MKNLKKIHKLEVDDNPFGSPTSPSSQGSARSNSLSFTAAFDFEQGCLVDQNNDDDKESEFDLNISFSGGYVPNTDLIRVDKGQGNPQFKIEFE